MLTAWHHAGQTGSTQTIGVAGSTTNGPQQCLGATDFVTEIAMGASSYYTNASVTYLGAACMNPYTDLDDGAGSHDKPRLFDWFHLCHRICFPRRTNYTIDNVIPDLVCRCKPIRWSLHP